MLRLDGDKLTKVANFALPGHPTSSTLRTLCRSPYLSKLHHFAGTATAATRSVAGP
jgi:hypothetical protein